MRGKKDTNLSYNLLLFSVILIFFVVSGAITLASNSGSSGNATLTIYDEIDLNGNLIKQSNKQFFFYANYTNSSGFVINESLGNGFCNISFNYTGFFTPEVLMEFNKSIFVWQYNRTFNYKGSHTFRVNCTSDYGNISLDDSFLITNTPVKFNVSKNIDGSINFDGNEETTDYFSCSEDSLCAYNFSANVSEPDLNDILIYSYNYTTLPAFLFSLNASSGILLINVTNNTFAGAQDLSVLVTDSSGSVDSVLFKTNISSVNDAPIFLNLIDKAFNISYLFNYSILVYDEENNYPFYFNISFLNCSVAQWSTRNCSTPAGKELFNSSYYSINETLGIINISFTPSKNDVGNYTINFSVTDSGIPNKTTSQVVTFSVLNVNSPPVFVYACDNERNWNEDDEISCVINVTDEDETQNLTLSANYSWFLFNHSANTMKLSASPYENVSFVVNFTATDSEVGRWNVNFVATDSEGRTNSSILQFNISNKNDSVSLGSIEDVTAYTTNYYEFFVNASDDDLLIPDKSVYNETLSFYSNFSCVNVTSLGQIANTNKVQAKISFNASNADCFEGGKDYSVKITVNDSNGFSSASRDFTIHAVYNEMPIWNLSTNNITAIEDSLLILNMSENVTDPQGDSLTFSYSSDDDFPSFSINANTGIIHFSAKDEDVGLHYVNISASDAATSSTARFNFTILNINDLPFIPLNNLTGIEGNGLSLIINSTYRLISATEDTSAELYVNVYDDDLRIPASQKEYYNESFVLNVSIEGPNQTIINFSGSSFIGQNRTKFVAYFTPRKADVGYYNVTLNVSDASNASYTINFTLQINSVNHFPNLTNIENKTSSCNSTFYYDINASDIEDGLDTEGNLTFFYNIFYNATPHLESLFSLSDSFNSTYGIINVTFNDSYSGIYGINISVMDKEGFNTTKDFWLFVYDNPNIISPLNGEVFNASENFEANFSFIVNHTIGDNLTYTIFVRNEQKYNISYFGDGTELIWSYTPNYTEESYGEYVNLTLFVFNPLMSYLNSSRTWNLNISHTNAPVYFNGTIPNSTKAIDQTISHNLLNYFSDVDLSDSIRNESLNYSVFSDNDGGITYSISNNIVTFSPSPLPSNGTFMITASDAEYNASSNWFMVEFVATQSSAGTTSTTGGSGGGGGTITKKVPVLLKLILPDPASMDKNDTIVLPVILSNEGEFVLNRVRLYSSVTKDGVSRSDVTSFLDNDYFESMGIGAKERVELTIKSNTNEIGVYEIMINASVEDPQYNDWGKVYITIHEGKKIEERILFIDEFIVGNPECAELKEVIDEAREALKRGDFKVAQQKSEEALAACKQAISQRPNPKKVFSSRVDLIMSLVVGACLVSFLIGVSYYFYRRKKLQNILEERGFYNFSNNSNRGV